jgi:hypothetical protein
MRCFVAVAVLMTIPNDTLGRIGHARDVRNLGTLRLSPTFLRRRLLVSFDNINIDTSHMRATTTR